MKAFTRPEQDHKEYMKKIEGDLLNRICKDKEKEKEFFNWLVTSIQEKEAWV